MPSIDDTLAERGSRYGEFTDHASVTQGIKNAMAQGENWGNMDDDQQECLEMIAHKIGRILNGDPNYVDSWTDIIGYTRLVEKRLIADHANLAAATPPGQEPDKDLGECSCFACLVRRKCASAADAKSELPKKDPTDKELADKVRGLAPGVHYIFVGEESSEL